MPVPVTALYGALTILLLTGLGSNVSRLRGKLKDKVEGVTEFTGANRAHGNAAEWVPPFMLMLLVAELSGGSSMVLHIFGGLFLTGRVSHALGKIGSKDGLTIVGAALTYLLMFSVCGYTLFLRVGT